MATDDLEKFFSATFRLESAARHVLDVIAWSDHEVHAELIDALKEFDETEIAKKYLLS
jgi:hypothetical protein